MGPAATADRAGYLVVTGVAVCYQAADKALQEGRRMLPAAIRLVLEETHWPAAPFPAAIDPHPGLRGGGLSLLLQHLHHRLIRIDDAALQQMLFQPSVQGLQPGLGRLDHPVGHGGPAQRNALPRPDLLLPVQRQAVHVLPSHGIGYVEGEARLCLIRREGAFTE